MKVAAIIPARGGSRRVPRKNLRKINGETLLARCIRQYRAAAHIVGPEIYVTTDDDEIAAEARRCGAKVVRDDRHSDFTTAFQMTKLCVQRITTETDASHFAMLNCTVIDPGWQQIEMELESHVYRQHRAVFTAYRWTGFIYAKTRAMSFGQ